MKKYFTWVVVPVLMFVMIAPVSAEAATMTRDQQISYLYAQIALLQVQLQALQQANGGVGSPKSTSYVSVETDGVNVVDKEFVEMDGRVTFKRSDDARVWFEYGESNALSYSTPSKLVKNKRSGDTVKFSLIAPDLRNNTVYYYRAVAEGEDGRYAEGTVKSFRFEGRSGSSNDSDDNDDEDTPNVTTDDADDVTTTRATLTGEVDMNDAGDGYVFFVYGEDEDAVDEVADELEYRDIDTDGDDIRKVVVDSSFDDDDTFEQSISGLTDDTDYYFRLCVEFEDEDDDTMLECGDVEEFSTDNY